MLRGLRQHRSFCILSWLLLATVLVALACGGGGTALVPQAAQQPAPAVQPAPAAPAAEPQPVAIKPPVSVAPQIPVSPGSTGVAVEGKPKPGGTLLYALIGDPDGGFDPHVPGGRGRSRPVIGLAEEYVAFHDVLPGEECGTSPQLWLGESWRFVDQTTIEFVLKKGIKFQNKPPVNGRELVAEDVVFSYRRFFDRGNQKTLAEKVTSLEAVDRYTVRIKTKAPHISIFGDLLAQFAANIMAKEAGGPEGRFDTKESVIGTGPFILESYTPGVGHVARRNPDYWIKDRPYLDEIRMPIMREVSTQLAALRVGKVDFLWNLSTRDSKTLLTQGVKARFFRCELAGNLTVQMRNDIPPFNDVRVRRAMSMAMDREGIIKGVYEGEGFLIGVTRRTIGGALKPEDFPPGTRRNLEYNPQEAKKLLAEAGYPKGLAVTAMGTLQYGSINRAQLEALPGMARPAGFDITLDVRDLADFIGRIDSWNYGVVTVSRVGGAGIAIEGEVSGHHSRETSSRNRSAVKDPELDALIDKMFVTLDQQERWKIAAQIQIRMVDQAYFINYPSPLVYFPLPSKFKGDVRLNSETVYYRPGLVFLDVWRED